MWPKISDTPTPKVKQCFILLSLFGTVLSFFVLDKKKNCRSFLSKAFHFYLRQVRTEPDVPPVLVGRRLAGPHPVLGPQVHRRGQLRGDHQDADQRASCRTQEVSNPGVHRLLRLSWSSAYCPQVLILALFNQFPT